MKIKEKYLCIFYCIWNWKRRCHFHAETGFKRTEAISHLNFLKNLQVTSILYRTSLSVSLSVRANLFVLLFVCAKAILLRNAYTSGSVFDSLPLVCALVRVPTHSIHVHSKRQRTRRGAEGGRESEKWSVWLSRRRRCRRYCPRASSCDDCILYVSQ